MPLVQSMSAANEERAEAEAAFAVAVQQEALIQQGRTNEPSDGLVRAAVRATYACLAAGGGFDHEARNGKVDKKRMQNFVMRCETRLLKIPGMFTKSQLLRLKVCVKSENAHIYFVCTSST